MRVDSFLSAYGEMARRLPRQLAQWDEYDAVSRELIAESVEELLLDRVDLGSLLTSSAVDGAVLWLDGMIRRHADDILAKLEIDVTSHLLPDVTSHEAYPADGSLQSEVGLAEAA